MPLFIGAVEWCLVVRREAVAALDLSDSCLYPVTCGLSLALPRPKILDQPQQHPRARVGIGELDMLVRVMADAAAAADEDHADIGNVDHGHAVMPGPARQLEHGKTFGFDRLRDLLLEPRCAGRGAVLVGDVELKCQLAALCDGFDLPHDIGDRALPV